MKIFKKIIDQYHYYQFVEQFWKSVFITLFVLLLNLIIYYPKVSQVFVRTILVYHSHS